RRQAEDAVVPPTGDVERLGAYRAGGTQDGDALHGAIMPRPASGGRTGTWRRVVPSIATATNSQEAGMLVSEWMTVEPRTVTPDTPVMEAMQYLRDGGYRRLPVTRNGPLVGIVTDRDLKEATPSKATTRSIYELNYLLSKLQVKDVMKSPVITVRAEDPIEQAAL